MRRRGYQGEDLVQTSFNEILLFLLFFALILLGTQAYLGQVPLDPNKGIGEESTGGSVEEVKPENPEIKSEPEPAGDVPKDNEAEKLQVIITDLREQKKALEDQLALLGRRVQKAEETNTNNERIIVILNGKVANLNGELQLTEGQLEDALKDKNGLVIINRNLEKERNEGQRGKREAEERAREAEGKIANLQGIINGLQQQAPASNTTNWPPFIKLADNDGYRFERNSAVPSGLFVKLFEENTVPLLEQLLDENADNIEAIEVIGHTDQERVGVNQPSNLDNSLLNVMLSGQSPGSMRAADNAGLGMARAATVARLLKRNLSSRFSNIPILPYSAAQLITGQNGLTTSLSFTEQDPSRRRVEIRLRGRSDEAR